MTRDAATLELPPTGVRINEDGLVVPGAPMHFASQERTMMNVLKKELEEKVTKVAYLEIDVREVYKCHKRHIPSMIKLFMIL